ncbi:MAG: hypothetical protein AB8B93_13845 [Pseudomonadales bacterium]
MVAFKKVNLAVAVQLTTFISILVGICLVIWELNQTRELAKAQLISDNYALLSSNRQVLMGENPASAIQKACLEPESLSSADIEVLNNHFWNMLTPPMRMRNIGLATGIYQEGEWRSFYPNLFPTILSFPYGRYWWKNMSGFIARFDPEISEFGDNFVRSISEKMACNQFHDGYLEDLRTAELPP